VHLAYEIAAAWIVLAIVFWIIFLRVYAGKPSDIAIPGWVFVIGIALWPISLVVGAAFLLYALVINLPSLFRRD
jgi:hypothetical protein